MFLSEYTLSVAAADYITQPCKYIGLPGVFSALPFDIHMCTNNRLPEEPPFRPCSRHKTVLFTIQRERFHLSESNIDTLKRKGLQRKRFIIMCRPHPPTLHLHSAVIRSFSCLMWYDILSPP